MVDGKAVRFSIDELSPFMVFDRAPLVSGRRVAAAVVLRELAALLLTALFWPVDRHRAPPLRREARARDADPLRAYRCSKIAARC